MGADRDARPPFLKANRRKYSPEAKYEIVMYYRKNGGRRTLKYVKKKWNGYERVDTGMLSRWSKSVAEAENNLKVFKATMRAKHRRGGPKVCTEFDQYVYDDLIIELLLKEEGGKKEVSLTVSLTFLDQNNFRQLHVLL